MNFTNIVDSDYTIATALGGFTTGTSPLEMASAYTTLENDGLYRKPTCVTSIVDGLAAIAEENAASTEETSASMLEFNEILSVCNKATGELRKLSEELAENTKHFDL